MRKPLTFNEINRGDELEYSRSYTKADDAVGSTGTARVHQKTQHLIVLDNGKYKTCWTKADVRQGDVQLFRRGVG